MASTPQAKAKRVAILTPDNKEEDNAASKAPLLVRSPFCTRLVKELVQCTACQSDC
jgi:hypothetical protein